jgi:antitoxin component YwqK of YwqJK toxin-antitoxin module
MDIKNVLKTNLIIFIQILCSVVYSQNNESKTDSVFKVDPSSMNKNNYFLTYELQREHHDEFDSEINTNLIWKKKNLDILWLIKSINLETQEDIKWESIDWSVVNSQPDTFYCETINNVPNGKWHYNSGDEKVIGLFINGLANGSWDKTEIHQNRKIHIHQEFLNGIPNGEWYEEVDGIKWYSHTFFNGKPNGIWTDNFDKNKKRETEYKNGVKNGICKTSKNDKIEQLYYYKDGIIDGDYFEYKENILVKKGSYNMGVPNKIWEIYKIDKTSKARYLALKYDFSNSTQIFISEYNENGKSKKTKVYEHTNNIVIGGRYKEIIFCPQTNGVCDCKTITYFINGNIEKIVYSGSKEYLANKKFILNYENGKTKYEGTYGGNIFYYDTAGKIVNQTVFSIDVFNDVNAN